MRSIQLIIEQAPAIHLSANQVSLTWSGIVSSWTLLDETQERDCTQYHRPEGGVQADRNQEHLGRDREGKPTL